MCLIATNAAALRITMNTDSCACHVAPHLASHHTSSSSEVLGARRLKVANMQVKHGSRCLVLGELAFKLGHKLLGILELLLQLDYFASF